MIHAKPVAIQQTTEEAEESPGKSEIAIVPLAMPLLAGPNQSVILAAHRGATVGHYVLIACSILVLAVVVWWCCGCHRTLSKNQRYRYQYFFPDHGADSVSKIALNLPMV